MNNSANKLCLVFDNKEINNKKPWTDDVLNRQSFAHILTNMVENIAPPLTISVNGKWGTGKTYLLRRWWQELKNEKYEAIYFNAWADDFCDNPLVAIIGRLFGEIDFPDKDKILKVVKKLAIKYMLGKANLTKKDLETVYGEIINNYSGQKNEIEELRTKLTSMINQQENGKPVIFIIDELDRCRPTYAVELLERIKHIFNIPGMFFVIGMNRLELQKSIKHVYGEIDAEDYLRRFYDIEISLSEPKSSEYCKHIINKNAKIFDYLIHEKQIRMHHDSYFDSIKRFLSLSF